MGGLPRRRRQAAGPHRAAYLMRRTLEHADGARSGAAQRCWRPSTSTPSRPPPSPPSPATRTMERRITAWNRWNAAAMVTRGSPATASAATSPPSPRRPGCTRRASTTSSAAGPTASGDQLYIQGHASPASTPAPSSTGGSPSSSWTTSARRPAATGCRPTRTRGGCPALGVPDRLHGPRPDLGDLPGALQPLSGQPRHQGHRRLARLGLPRRRRDGRARVDGGARPGRARAARQPHLRHQLQPAAPRRPGARQLPDRPGAGRPFRGAGWNVIKRCGAPPGTSCSRWTPPARCPPAARGAGRAVPDVRHPRRGLHPRALLRRRALRLAKLLTDDEDRRSSTLPRRPRAAQGVRGVPAAASSTRAPRR